MAEKIKAIIWDMGGVFLRSMDWKLRSQLAKEYNMTLDEIHQLVFNSESAKLATIGSIDVDTHWKTIGTGLAISVEETQLFRRRFFEGDGIDYTLIDYIRSLKKNFTTALLSNAWSDARDNLTFQKPCMDAFQISVFSCEVGLAKPDPAIFRLMIELCGIKPSEAIFVDDAEENITAAIDFGIHGIQFIDPLQAMQDVERTIKEFS